MLERHRNSRFQQDRPAPQRSSRDERERTRALETRESGHEPRMPRRTEAMVTRRARENSEGQRSRGRFAPVAGARDRLHRCREIDSSQESWLGLRLLTHLVTRDTVYVLQCRERPALCLLFKASGIKVAHAP